MTEPKPITPSEPFDYSLGDADLPQTDEYAKQTAPDFKMNPEVKVLLLDALRSDEYPQAKMALHRAVPTDDGVCEGYCCLGVLTDLAVKAGIGTWQPAQDVYAKGGVSADRWDFVPAEQDSEYDRDGGLLHRKVQEWAGIPVAGPYVNVEITETEHRAIDYDFSGVPGYEKKVAISALNDHSERTFSDIADLIEEQW